MRNVSKVIVALVVIVVLVCDGSSAQYYQTPQIPCPNIFEYGNDGFSNFGMITLRDVSYGTTTVQIEMTQPGVLNQEYSGKLSLNIDKDRVFDHIRSGMPVTYRVDFPLQNVIPRVTDITVNNVRICSGPRDPPPRATVNLEHTLRTYATLSAGQQQQPQFSQPQFPQQPNIIPSTIRRPRPSRPIAYPSVDLNTAPFDAMEFFRQTFNTHQHTTTPESSLEDTNPFGFRIPSQFGSRNPPPTAPATETETRPFITTGPSTTRYIDSICGQENNNFSIKKLAVNGEVIDRSRFPWIVAIYTRNASTLSFQCGGSLISARTVVSAAHCFQQGLEVIRIENLLLSMGRHSLTEWDNAVNLGVQQLIRHPDYRPEVDNFDADLAIVQLKESVTESTAKKLSNSGNAGHKSYSFSGPPPHHHNNY